MCHELQRDAFKTWHCNFCTIGSVPGVAPEAPHASVHHVIVYRGAYDFWHGVELPLIELFDIGTIDSANAGPNERPGRLGKHGYHGIRGM